LAVGRQLLPPLGVYAVRVVVLRPSGGGPDGETIYDGVANLGRRPTFAGEEVRLEVHLFDFAGDLYGRRLRVDFIDRVRPERRFDGLESLKAQIKADCAEARSLIKATASPGGAPGGQHKAGG
jgi:riboflavin kinase/FMN adenylyltransferase